MACRHSCRNVHVLLECVWMCEHGITCALRCGVALVGDFLYWALLTPLWEKIFKYWWYPRKWNSIEILVVKKARFGFVVYFVKKKIMDRKLSFCPCKRKEL